LDTSQFTTILDVQAIRVLSNKCQILMKLLKGKCLDRPRLKSVIPDPEDPKFRLILLKESVTCEGDLPAEALAKIQDEGLTPFITHQVKMDYEYFTAEQILKQVLPAGVEVPGSFETIGHVAHLNLRDELLPYKSVIGKVLLDKNGPRIRTIVNKVGTIANTFRVPTFEVIAGDSSLETEVKQHGAVFKLDFGLVYWNSRLEKEHARLVGKYLSRSGTVVCDMMAGIGPFAVPAALKGCTVFANDLNPDSTKYLAINAKLNKVEHRIKVFTMCGRAFVRHLLGHGGQSENASEPSPANESAPPVEAANESAPPVEAPVMFQHVVMNLPATAIEFLDVFKGAFSPKHWTAQTLPMVHCYLFAKTVETSDDIIQRGKHHLGGDLLEPIVHNVRDVAPNKHMYCLSFKISAEVAFATENDDKSEEIVKEEELVTEGEECAADAKRQRVD